MSARSLGGSRAEPSVTGSKGSNGLCRVDEPLLSVGQQIGREGGDCIGTVSGPSRIEAEGSFAVACAVAVESRRVAVSNGYEIHVGHLDEVVVARSARRFRTDANDEGESHGR